MFVINCDYVGVPVEWDWRSFQFDFLKRRNQNGASNLLSCSSLSRFLGQFIWCREISQLFQACHVKVTASGVSISVSRDKPIFRTNGIPSSWIIISCVSTCFATRGGNAAWFERFCHVDFIGVHTPCAIYAYFVPFVNKFPDSFRILLI